MIHHISIAVRDPHRVARAIAEIWQGSDFPFPPNPGSYVVFAGDDRGTVIEIYPLGSELVQGESEVVFETNAFPPVFSATHAAISVPLDITQIAKIASREGWRLLKAARGSLYEVIELWVENNFLLELLTPEMVPAYLASMTPQTWQQVFSMPTAA